MNGKLFKLGSRDTTLNYQLSIEKRFLRFVRMLDLPCPYSFVCYVDADWGIGDRYVDSSDPTCRHEDQYNTGRLGFPLGPLLRLKPSTSPPTEN